MGSQGFRNIAGNPFVYQEDTRSAAFGLDASAQKWKLSVKATAGALPTDTPQLMIDPATNGDVTIDPNGSGNLVVTSGNVSLTAGNLALPLTTATVGQITMNGARYLHSYGGDGNVFLGKEAGRLVTASGNYNIGIGYLSLNEIAAGASNCCIGQGSGQHIGAGSWNMTIGQGSGYSVTSGNYNTSYGAYSMYSLTTGNNNICIGSNSTSVSPYGSGGNYTGSESSNICIHNYGVTGESNKIRIGTQGTGAGQQNAAYIAGIYGVTVGATNGVVQIDNAGQLGSTNSPSVTGTVTAGTGFTATTGGVSITAGNLNLPVTSSTGGALTGGFITVNSHRFIHNYGHATGGVQTNIFIGDSTGNLSAANSGYNCIIGEEAAQQLTNSGGGYNGGYNNILGSQALLNGTTAQFNSGIGSGAFTALTTGYFNTALAAWACARRLVDGKYNTFIGVCDSSAGGILYYGSGYNYTASESHNILIGNAGVGGESNKIRIGSYGTGTAQQDTAYIAGVVHCSNGLTVDTGNATLTSGNLLLPTSSSTVGQIQINTVRYFHNYSPGGISTDQQNVFIGPNAGNFSCTSTTGCNYALGGKGLNAITSGQYNIALGFGGLQRLTSGEQNTVVAAVSGAQYITTGSYNTAIGAGALWGGTGSTLTSGNGNTAIGLADASVGSGRAHTGSDSWNIDIGHVGISGDSNVMRLGTAYSSGVGINKTYIAGTYGVTPGGTINVALVDSNGQLGSTATLSPAQGGAMTWTEVTGTSQAAAVGNGYITNNVALVTVTLPATAAVGQRVAIIGKGAGLWKLAQNSGQTIHFGSIDSTTGTGGYLAATVKYDCLEVICITANTDWVVRDSVGSITVV